MTHKLLFPASELLETILTGQQAADQQMQKYFRGQRTLASRDRGFIAETVYACLRQKRLPEYLLDNPVPAAAERIATYLVTRQGWSARALLAAGYVGDANALVTQLRGEKKSSLPNAVKADLPDAIFDRLAAQLGEEQALRLAMALNEPAPVDLRVNTLKTRRDDAAASLAGEGFAVETTPLSPVGLRRHERAPLFKTRAFQDGHVEVQDEGSQLLGVLLEPGRREMVVDFCAGAGGKTLHIGALMANSGSLYAFDISEKRLENIKPRLKRAGLDTVRTTVIENEHERRVQNLYGKVDRVLVDAPCTGLGTLRRNPDIKWRAFNIDTVNDLQTRILAAAARLLKPGGRLVYATCSPLREENEDIIAAFLADNPDFAVLPVNAILARRGIPLSFAEDQPYLRLFTHIHNTDSFFAAVLVRKS